MPRRPALVSVQALSLPSSLPFGVWGVRASEKAFELHRAADDMV
jgi:hypothetical protein